MTTAYIRGTGVEDALSIAFPTDSTLGPSVNQAKHDVTNDEVAFGASAGQTGATSPYSLICLGTTNANVIKPAPGRLYSVYITNSNAAVRWVKFYNKATTPDENDTPVLRYATSVSSTHPMMIHAGAAGIAFSAGIAIRIVTAQADASTAAPTAGDVVVSATYK